MIARIWHGKTLASRADDYLDFLERTGLEDYRQTEGNLGVYALRRIMGSEAHFLLITLWEDEAAIRRFAGEEIAIAHYYPGDEEYLLEFEPAVEHYEVLRRP